jgi:hypothetical protein
MQTPTTVTANALNADAVATLRAEMYPRRLTRLTINGPKGSRAEVYLGAVSPSTRVDGTSRGSSNTSDSPLDIPAGMTVSVAWIGKAAQSNQANATFLTERL